MYVCFAKESEDNPLFQIHSRGKRNGQVICFTCMKHKLEVIRLYNERLMRIPNEKN